MRELIRNERRIELCFENFRFWDLRRWNVDLTKLNENCSWGGNKQEWFCNELLSAYGREKKV